MTLAKLCGATVATRAGSHLRCLLPADHDGDCSPKIRNPRVLSSSELQRHAAAMLRDTAAGVAEELERRALKFDQVRNKAAIALRRGHKLPTELLELIDVDDTIGVSS